MGVGLAQQGVGSAGWEQPTPHIILAVCEEEALEGTGGSLFFSDPADTFSDHGLGTTTLDAFAKHFPPEPRMSFPF